MEEIEAFDNDKMKFYIIRYLKAMNPRMIHFIRKDGIFNANLCIKNIYQAQSHLIPIPLLLLYIPSDKGVEITHGYQLQIFPQLSLRFCISFK